MERSNAEASEMINVLPTRMYDLPEKPVLTIEPHKSWVPLNLRDSWACRELLYFAIRSVLLLGLLVYFALSMALVFLMILPLILGRPLLALGVVISFSSLNVKYRYVRYALPFLIQVWFYVSPIISPSSLVL